MPDNFESEYCRVRYIAGDNAVFLAWKKYADHDDYRAPTLFALEKLRETGAADLIIDARNGFEDHPDDAAWAKEELLPAMAKTSLRRVVFIMQEVNEIEGEMDMWTNEFRKYFTVDRVTGYTFSDK